MIPLEPTKTWSNKLTIERFDNYPPDLPFACGIVESSVVPAITEKNILLKWVAVKGYNNDWAIYVDHADKSYKEIALEGTKIIGERVIHRLVNCDPDLINRYRFK